MPSEIIKQIKIKLSEKKITSKKINACLLGVTFKENVPDIRNSLSLTLAKKLKEGGFNLMVCDPYIEEDIPELEIKSFSEIENEKFDILIVSVPHKEIIAKEKGWFKNMLKEKSLFVDIYGAIEGLESDFSL